MLLGPFEQLEREFGWEGGSTAPIRPPSAFCSLADIQEDLSDEDECNDDLISESVMGEFSRDLVSEEAACLNDSGVCDLQEERRPDQRKDLR